MSKRKTHRMCMSSDTPGRVYLAQPGDGLADTTNQAGAFAEWVVRIRDGTYDAGRLTQHHEGAS